jgi:nucleoside-diphosphate-sugar epimerase
VTWGEYQQHIVEASGKGALKLHLPELCVDVAGVFGELMTKVDGKPRLFNRQKALLGKQEAWTCTSDRARSDFGYSHEVELRDGVEETLSWYRSTGWV